MKLEPSASGHSSVVRSFGREVLLVSAACGVALGWWLERHSVSDAEKKSGQGSFGPAAAAVARPESSGASVTARDTKGKGVIHAADFDEAVHHLEKLSGGKRSQRIYDLVRSLPVEEIPAALEQARQSPKTMGENYYNPREIISALASRWAEIDPRSALTYGLEWKDDELRSALLETALVKWVQTSLSAATSWAEQLPPGESRDELFPPVIAAVEKKDPRRALMLAKEMSQGAAQRMASQVIVDWVHSDPESAAAATIEWKLVDNTFWDQGQPLPYGGESFGEIWGRKNPEAALAWVANLPIRNREVTGKICDAWAVRDPAAALAWVLHSDDQSLRASVIKKGMPGLAAKDLSKALTEIRKLPTSEERDSALAAAVQGAAKSNPKGAANLLEQLPAGPARDAAAAKICQAWAATDPHAALDWLFAKAPASPPNSAETDGAIKKWLATAPGDAVAWARALPAGENRDAALGSIVSCLAASDLKLAQSIFNELPPESQGNAAGELANQFAMDDFDQARAWAESLPAGAGQTAAIAKIAEIDANVDPKEMSQWLNTLPPGPARDGAVVPLTKSIQKEDPEGAMVWALSIADPQDREDRLENLTWWWKMQNPSAARAWINSAAQLTPAEKRHLLAQ